MFDIFQISHKILRIRHFLLECSVAVEIAEYAFVIATHGVKAKWKVVQLFNEFDTLLPDCRVMRTTKIRPISSHCQTSKI